MKSTCLIAVATTIVSLHATCAPCFAFDVSQFDVLALRYVVGNQGFKLRDLIQRYEFNQVGNGYVTAPQYNAISQWFGKICPVDSMSESESTAWLSTHKLAENTQDPRAVQLNNVGVVLLNSKDYENALKAFDAALDFSPTYTIAKGNRNLVKRRRVTDSKLLQDLYWKVYSEPTNSESSKRLDDAIKLLGYNPESAEHRAFLGDAQERAGNTIAALVEYRASLALQDDAKIRAHLDQINATLDSPSNSFYDSTKNLANATTGSSAGNRLNSHSSNNPNYQNNVDYSAYVNSVQELIKKRWRASNRSLNHTKVLFQIAKDGRVISAKIDSSSGDPAIDKVAMDAVQAASPFHPLPTGAPDAVDVLFSFDVNESKTKSAPSATDDGTGRGPFGSPFGGKASSSRSSSRRSIKVGLYRLAITEKVFTKWKTVGVKNKKPVVVLFRILTDGHIENLRVYRSSGDAHIDALVCKTISDCAPFTAPPLDLINPFDVEFWFDPVNEKDENFKVKSSK